MTQASTKNGAGAVAPAARQSWLMRSGDEARADLELQGVSIAEWARSHGFTYSAVRQVLAGRCAARYGVGHKIAVALGMKPAYLSEIERAKHLASR